MLGQPDLKTFLTFDDAAVAAQLQAARHPCWAVALGGTRRAYLAEGGVIGSHADLDRYFLWVEAAQRKVLEQLFGLGVKTIIAVCRLPQDRGADYQAFAQQAIQSLVEGDARRAFYDAYELKVQVAGDVRQLATAVTSPDLLERFHNLAATTATAGGAQLIYLFRGAWVEPATEEALLGYRVGQQLGHAPSRDDLLRAYYGTDVPPLTVYVGSGRPQLTYLRPPLLGGAEDLYWAQPSPINLTPSDWRRIIYDHLWQRRTHSVREYPADSEHRESLAALLTQQVGHIIGVGTQHALGFWMPEEHHP